MFSTDAWKDLVEDVREMLASTNTLDGATPENVGFKQGEVSIMRWLLSLPEMTETAYEELTSAND